MADKNYVMLPVGRFISGNVYEKQEVVDYETKAPRVNKNGEKMQEFKVGIAIPKGAEQHWSQTPWGAQIVAAGVEGWGAGIAQPHNQIFAWKITDGDSTIANKQGVVPASNVNWKNSWIIWTTQRFDLQLYDATSSPVRPSTTPGVIAPGFYIRGYVEVRDNKPSKTPGVYIDILGVALVAYGERMQRSVDLSNVGFDVGLTLPHGASLTPVDAVPFMPQAAPLPYTPPQGVAQALVAPLPYTPPQAQPVPVAPPPPAAVPSDVPPGFVLTDAANGHTYSSYTTIGWTHEQMLANGIIRAA